MTNWSQTEKEFEQELEDQHGVQLLRSDLGMSLQCLCCGEEWAFAWGEELLPSFSLCPQGCNDPRPIPEIK